MSRRTGLEGTLAAIADAQVAREAKTGDHTAAAGITVLMGLGLCTTVAMGMLIGSLGVELPTIGRQVGAPLASLGLIFTAYRLGSLIGAWLAGPRNDRGQARPLLLASCAAMAAGFAIFPLMHTLPLAFAALVLYGTGSGAHLTTTMYLAGGLRRPALGTGALQVAFAIGDTAGPLLAGTLLARTGSYTPISWGLALALLIALAAYIRVPAPQGPRRGSRARSPLVGAGRPSSPMDVRLLLLGCLAACYLGLETSFAGWSYTLAGAAPGAVLVPTAFWAAAAASSLLPGLLGRLPSWAVPVASLIGAAALLLLAAGVGGQPGAVACAAVLGACCGPIFPVVLAWAAAWRPGSAGRAVGWVAGTAQAGAMAIPALCGLAAASSPRLALLAQAATCLLMAILAVAVMLAPGKRTDVFG